MSLIDQSAVQLLAMQASGQTTAVEIANAHFEQISQQDSKIKAFLGLDKSGAFANAERIDQKRRSGEKLGLLAGIPVAVKDNMCVTGWNVSCASKMLENFVSPYDAHVIERLKAEDAILIGRTNQDEFAMGSSCENSAFQSTFNPWDLQRAPGGSSGGSAAAVSGNLSTLSLGSDTGGSIRQPAAFCGIVGLKPTYGRVSRYGLVAFASSLDQIGPMGRSVADVALLLQAISGHDPRDTTSSDVEVPDYQAALQSEPQRLRIGIVKEHFMSGLDEQVLQGVKEAIEVYRKAGAEIVPVELPHTRYGVAAYYVIAPSEASSNLARFDGIHYGHRATSFTNLTDLYETSRGEGFGDEVKRRIMVGTYALSSGYYDAYYLKALKVRRKIADDFTSAFKQVDMILSPTSPTTAFKLGEHAADPIQMYLNDIYTIGANLAGLPAISVPCGLSSERLPMGMQLVGPAFSEVQLLQAASLYESATDWHNQKPA